MDNEMNLFLTLGERQQRSIIEWLRPIVNEYSTRRRRLRAKDEQGQDRWLVLIMANILKYQGYDQRIRYSNSDKDYIDSVYKPPGLGRKALCRCLDALDKAGLIVKTKGKWLVRKSQRLQPTFRPTPELVEGIKFRGLSDHQPRFRLDEVPVVVLKSKDEQGKKERVRYEATDEPQARLIAQMRRINEFLDQQEIEISPEVMPSIMEWANEIPQERFLPSMTDKFLYRVFNNYRTGYKWDEGGRMYGGWWISLPEEFRTQIRINGQEVVELDYCAVSTRMIYHLEGRECPYDDPYEIPALVQAAERDGMDWQGEARDGVKKLTNALLNCTKRQRPWVGNEKYTLPPSVSGGRAVKEIMDYHQDISDWFKSGRGVQLMYRDSEIALEILERGIRNEVVVLPIHDSFIVQARHRDWLEEQMKEVYRTQIGFDPIVK